MHQMSLLLPGKVLDISALNTSHKFRGRGNKEGAVAAIHELQAAGLGTVKEERATRGTTKVLIHAVCCVIAKVHSDFPLYSNGGHTNMQSDYQL